MNRRLNTGFTLVEIAIVLVVAGLLIGAVLKSNEMVVNAKLKRIESDTAGILVAMFSYQDRYLQLPGDDSRAHRRFDIYKTLVPANVNGDGTGTIDGAWDAINILALEGSDAEESEKFFAHLRASGLIPGGGKDTTRPTTAYGGRIGIQNGALQIPGHATIFGELDGRLAKILEARLDDGEPESGRIQADSTAEALVVGSPSNATEYDDSAMYNVVFRL